MLTSQSPLSFLAWLLGSDISPPERIPRKKSDSDQLEEEFSGVEPLAQGGCAHQLLEGQTEYRGERDARALRPVGLGPATLSCPVPSRATLRRARP